MNDYLITEKDLVMRLSGDELLINLKKMRLACPCAYCKGEKDVFGNVYKLKIDHPLLDNSFKIKTIKKVGNYAFRVFWEDNHSNGIYTFDFLKTLSE